MSCASSGVFVERQYCSFAGIFHGQKSTDFIKTLVERRFATPIATGKLHRGRMFHLHYKTLWAAVGEPDNRFRKPAAPGRMIERVMILDGVLDEPTCTWLGPAVDKRRHFMRHLESRLDMLRVLRVGGTLLVIYQRCEGRTTARWLPSTCVSVPRPS